MVTIGIDLGTTNSLVAYWTENGPQIIPNVLGSNLTPSVVSVDDNNDILVGEVARERLITHPHLTASVFKRYMGTEKEYHLGKYSFSAEELSSFVIKSLKEDAEAFFGEEVREAVISVPAYFNDVQRKATKRAAELAGLKVERLISEPTAAAIAYGLHQKESETSFMVFDLGGGTFDVSILELFEGVMEVRSIAGDNFLGGEDFTNALISYFVESKNIEVGSINEMEKSILYKQAEMCKRALANEGKGRMEITLKGESYDVSIDRILFEKIVSDLLIRLRHPIERALRDASLKPKDLDAVILIGGATRMPIIKSVVSKMFGKLPFCNINPDEAVALGAAIQVALKERNEALSELILTDVCPYTLGTGVAKSVGEKKYESGFFFPIIERNTPIPVSKVERLATISDNQIHINIGVYQGESRMVKDNLKLGELNIEVPPNKAGEEQFDVRYTYDINGILEVEVHSLSNGERKRLVIEKNKGSMTKEEIEERLYALKDIKIHPRDRMENKLLIAKGERLYQESLGEKREYIGSLLQGFEHVMSLQDDREIRHAAKKLKEQLEKLEGWYDY
ncbi:molecular chaperone HscC [Anaeromicropila herbilytica]|uniref:Chaperone protein DnaK n=1 Tax=Anaeromicropila herbilytica TaxID=2785025 RepID=A0A7R7EPX4_9FIRM|nr:molecular chaperone HscC [Anaeromicropila herbilytica]BCN32327.1 molecular chaperone HscC [Anaeromicropila herbilytica]